MEVSGVKGLLGFSHSHFLRHVLHGTLFPAEPLVRKAIAEEHRFIACLMVDFCS